METPPGPTESFVHRFEALAGTSAKRRVDLELRMLDLMLAAFFLLVTLPVTLLIAALMLATDGPPLFYRGERVGRGGRMFTMIKFRTLKRGAEERGAESESNTDHDRKK